MVIQSNDRCYINQGDWLEAEKTINIGKFAYAGRFTENIENLQLMAEIAKHNNNPQAAKLFEKSASIAEMPGIMGPGSFGVNYYAPRLFKRNAIAVELIGQN